MRFLFALVLIVPSSALLRTALAGTVEVVIQETMPAYDEDADPAGFDRPEFFQGSPDERLLLAGTPRDLYVYDLRSRVLLRHFRNPQSSFFGAVTFDPTGRFLLTHITTAPAYDPEPTLIDLETGEQETLGYLQGDFDASTQTAIPPDPITATTGNLRKDDPWTIRVGADTAVFSQDSTGNSVRTPLVSSLEGEPQPIPLADGTLMRWLGSQRVEVTAPSGGRAVIDLIPNPDLRFLPFAQVSSGPGGVPFLYASHGNEVVVIDTHEDSERARIPAQAWEPDNSGERIVLLDPDGVVAVHELVGRTRIKVLTNTPGEEPVFAISGNGKFAAAWDASQMAVIHYDLVSGRSLRIPWGEPGDDQWPSHLAYNHDGSRLAVSDWTSVDTLPLQLVDTQAGTVMAMPEVILPSFDPSGRYLAFAWYAGNGGGQVGVFDLVSQSLVFKSESFELRGYGPDSITFTPDSRNLLISNGYEGILQIELTRQSSEQPPTLIAGNFSGQIRFQGNSGTVNSGTGEVVRFDWDRGAAVETLRLYPLDTGRFVGVTPEHRYFGKPDSLDAIAFRRGFAAFPVDQFDLLLNQPHVIQALLGASPDRVALLEATYRKRLRREGVDETQFDLASAQLPELVVVNRPDLPLATSGGEVELQLQAADRSGSLKELQVYVNDVPLGRLDLSTTKGLKIDVGSIRIPLAVGENRIQASAFNEAGLESLRQTIQITRTVAAANAPDLYLLAVGVSDYANNDLDLSVAAKDALDLSSAFQGIGGDSAFGEIKVRTVLDQEATREAILAAGEFLKESTPDDCVIVFVAGHGFQDEAYEYWFGTHDIDYEKPAERGLSYDSLEGLFDGIAARKRLLLMDTCFAGEVDKEELRLAAEKTLESTGLAVRASKLAARGVGKVETEGSLAFQNELFAQFRKRTGATVLTASSGVEFVFAEENGELGNGVFTHALMKGLQSNAADLDNDRHLRLSEWMNFAFSEVVSYTSGRQRPTGRQINRELNFVVRGK